MEEQLISFKTAKLAKEKGFNEFCYSLYQNSDILLKDCFEYNPSLKYYNSDYKPSKHNINWYLSEACSAPTQSLLQKWLREEYDIHVNINPRYNLKKLGDTLYFAYEISTLSNLYGGIDDNLDKWLEGDLNFHIESSYEEALERGLQEALKLIKNE